MGRTLTLEQAQALGPGALRDWAYNALDCTGTREVADVLAKRLSARHALIYGFERALQAPSLSMMLRGVRVDTVKRAEMVAELKRELAKDLRVVAADPLVAEVWDATELETGFCEKALGKHHLWPRGVPDGPGKLCKRCGASRIRCSSGPNVPFMAMTTSDVRIAAAAMSAPSMILNGLTRISSRSLKVDGSPSAALTTLEAQVLAQDSALDLPAPLVGPHDRIAVRGYELREKLGDGRLGPAYRAFQPVVGREVAIKILRPELANDKRFIQRFEAEAEVVARLEHPHIAPLYDYWREPDAAYLVQRLFRRGSLADALQAGRA